jgi:thiol-disulfide isomerase/thioredoxin
MRLLESTSCLLALALALAASGCSSSSSTPAVTPGDDAGADTTPAPPAYPDESLAPYGLLAHQTFPNLTWKGHRDGTGPLVDISMSDYYDPDGKKGLTAVYFIVAAEWCGPCNAEAEVSPKIYGEAYKPRGAKYVSVVIEDKAQKPATLATLDSWISTHKINFDMGLYPSKADHSVDVLPNIQNVGLPHNYIIDPHTMVIQSITQGVDPAVWACDMYKGDTSVGTDGCCVAGKTKYSDGSDVCTVDYACSKGLVCLPPGDTKPSIAMEVVMTRNGAKPFGS